MKALVQRVREARVEIAGEVVGSIGAGLLLLLCAERGDDPSHADRLLAKLLKLRIFSDEAGKMNLDLPAVGGSLLAISQFTLLGDVRKGRRPSFTSAMAPDPARELFERFVALSAERGIRVETGRFRAEMAVELVNDGPVTILLDTKGRF